MSPDLSPCTNEFGRDRLASAESYIEAAEGIAESEDVNSAAARFKNNTIITNYKRASRAAIKLVQAARERRA